MLLRNYKSRQLELTSNACTMGISSFPTEHVFSMLAPNLNHRES